MAKLTSSFILIGPGLHAVRLPGWGLARGRQGPPTPRVWVWEGGSRDGTATANVRILTRKTSLWVGARHAVVSEARVRGKRDEGTMVQIKGEIK